MNRSVYLRTTAGAAFLWSQLLLAPCVAAQSPADTSLANAVEPAGEEIVVTARREAESLLNVPVQVTVQTGEQLARTNTNDLPKLAENIPFVTIGKMTGGSGGGYIIRGIGNFSGDVGVKQTVLLNLDNVFVGRAKIINQGMFDIGQVEVLKGPQALFYGKNSPAGVISISTVDPGSDLQGYARAGYEFNADERFVEGAVSVPVTDQFAVRLAGRASGMKGYLRNNATGYAVHPLAARFPYLAAFPVPGASSDRSPRSTEKAVRMTAVWKPQDGLTAKLKYAYAISHQNGDSGYLEFACRPGVTAITTAGIVDTQNDCNLDRNIAYGNFPVGLTAGQPGANGGVPYATTETHLTSLNIDYANDDIALSSITGYYHLSYHGAQNAFQDSLGTLWAVQSEVSSGISQEFRVNTKFDSPVNAVAGVYLAKTKQHNRTFADIVALGYGFDPVAGTYDTYHRLINQKSSTLSAFGQLRWDILENLELNGGVRFTSEKNEACLSA